MRSEFGTLPAPRPLTGPEIDRERGERVTRLFERMMKHYHDPRHLATELKREGFDIDYDDWATIKVLRDFVARLYMPRVQGIA